MQLHLALQDTEDNGERSNRNKVLWSDETKIKRFCQIQHRHVWRRNRDPYKEKHLIPTVKYGGGSVCFRVVLIPEVQGPG